MSKIIGGEVVSNIDKLPFMAYFKKDDKYLCSGTMISEEHFLTAAQCVYLHKDDGPQYKGLSVTFGTTHTEKGGNKSPISCINVNKYYRLNCQAFGSNDIAVVTVSNL